MRPASFERGLHLRKYYTYTTCTSCLSLFSLSMQRQALAFHQLLQAFSHDMDVSNVVELVASVGIILSALVATFVGSLVRHGIDLQQTYRGRQRGRDGRETERDGESDREKDRQKQRGSVVQVHKNHMSCRIALRGQGALAPHPPLHFGKSKFPHRHTFCMQPRCEKHKNRHKQNSHFCQDQEDGCNESQTHLHRQSYIYNTKCLALHCVPRQNNYKHTKVQVPTPTCTCINTCCTASSYPES